MGKKQDQLLRDLQQQLAAANAKYDAQLAALNTPDPLTQNLRSQAQNVLSAAESGDYRQAPKGIFFDFVDPAMRKRQRDLSMNVGAQGISAIGTPNSTLLSLSRQNLDDEFDRDQAANYQQNWKSAVGNAQAVAGNLGSQELQKKVNILGLTANQLGQSQDAWYQMAVKKANQPSAWTGFLNTLIGNAGNIAAGVAKIPGV